MPSSKVMDKFKKGTLRSGGKGKNHPKVKSLEQAIAIKMSEERVEKAHGGHYPDHTRGGLGGPSSSHSHRESSKKKKSFAKALNK